MSSASDPFRIQAAAAYDMFFPAQLSVSVCENATSVFLAEAVP